MAVPVATGLTRADLDDLPDDGHRRELVDGRLFVSPLARVRHQRVVMEVAYRLRQWVERHGGAVYPGVNVDLADDTHFEPDVVYATDADSAGLALERAPELVVEVSSPSTRSFDLGVKKDRYGAAGAAEFWFVDLDADRIDRFVQADGRLVHASTHGRGEQLTTELLPGLVIEVDEALGPAPSDR